MRKGVNLVLFPLWDGEGALRSSRLEPNDPFATLTHNFAYAKLPLILALLGEGEVGAKDNGGKSTKKNPRRLPRAFFVAPPVGLEPTTPCINSGRTVRAHIVLGALNTPHSALRTRSMCRQPLRFCLLFDEIVGLGSARQTKQKSRPHLRSAFFVWGRRSKMQLFKNFNPPAFH